MFFQEVKDGASTLGTHSRIDAMAIKISWTKPCIVGYEIKVSKSDFRRDEKWMAYLPMCNQLYFAVAPGVCTADEIPEMCGLVQYTENGGLRTLKKAPYRVIAEPVDVYKHLMFKHIGEYGQIDHHLPRPARLLQNVNAEAWRDYLEDKKTLRDMGTRVSRKFSLEIEELNRKLKRAERNIDNDRNRDEELYEICKALEVSTTHPLDNCLKAIGRLKKSGGVSQGMINRIRQLSDIAVQLRKDAELTAEEEKQ
jgi:hypothetical protein